MIVDGAITYGNTSGGILFWRFSDDIINELAIATLLTILSFQIVETLLNLFFGFKQKGKAKMSNLHIMLLIRKSSPWSVLKNCFKSGRENEDPHQDDDYQSEKETDQMFTVVRVYAKLAFLLLAIPVVNIATVVLSLERDSALTFADANFGGLAFGLDLEQRISQWSPVASTLTNSCEATELQVSTAEFPIADFSTCIRELRKSSSANSSLIRVITEIANIPEGEKGELDAVFVTVSVGVQSVEYTKRAMLVSRNSSTLEEGEERNLFILRSVFKEEDAEFLTARGLELAKSHCDSTDNEVKQKASRPGRIAISHSLACRRESERTENEDLQSARAVAQGTLQVPSFVNSDKLLVRNSDEENQDIVVEGFFIPADDLFLFRRRRGFVSIPIMAIATLAAILLRALSEIVSTNDIEQGIGLILRDGLGLPCCDSMLSSKNVVVRYDRGGNTLLAVEREDSNLQE